MKCPRCPDSLLSPALVETVTIDRCPSCHGMWLDATELEKLVELRPASLLKDDARFTANPSQADRLACPACTGARLIKLSSLDSPGTILDSCTVCFGTWLDAGELDKLVHPGLKARIRSLFGLS